MPTTRAQRKANSGSPLQSLSQQAKESRKPRQPRGVVKKEAPATAKAKKAATVTTTASAKGKATTAATAATATAAALTTATASNAAANAVTSSSNNTTTTATGSPVKATTTRTTRKRVLRKRESPPPMAPSRVPKMSGEELLQLIVDARDESRRKTRNVAPDSDERVGDASQHAQPATPATASPLPATPAKQASAKKSPAHQSLEKQVQPTTPSEKGSPAHPATPATAGAPANPTTPATQVAAQPTTPRTTGWGIRSLFSSFLPSILSPGRKSAAATPATGANAASASQSQSAAQPATPQILLDQDSIDQIGAGLAPTPSRPSTRRTTRSKAKAQSQSSSKSSRGESAIIKTAVRDVNAEQKDLATAWAQKTAQKITADPAALGEKRRQLEQPMKLRDVKDIPARRPWEATGSFGLLPEFFDDSDSDEEAPGWYLVDQLANEQPPLKKRKTSSGGSPANATEAPPVANESRHRIIDTHGNSSSLYDLSPRPSFIPSPMFDNPSTHHDGANLFAEHRFQTAPVEVPAPRVETPDLDREAFLKELRRTGHVAGSGSFCVPEGDSDESDSDEEILEDQENQENMNAGHINTGLPWTQKPPPPPTPAHAKLPVQPDASSFVPEVKQQPKTVDPVKAQRAKAMKHTPAKQSRLREVMLPSPSLRSDAGASPMVTTASPSLFAPAPTVNKFKHMFDDCPDPVPLEFPTQELEDDCRAACAKGLDMSMYDFEVVYTYGEVDEDLINEEGDDEL